ncbi:MAG: Cytochrome c oxidase subunit [Pseudomonadota bacterium]|jgi:putative heme-binding domain-containing protein
MILQNFRKALLGSAAVLLLCSSGAGAQEHSYAPSDIENGRGLYQANCLGCHGNNGDSVEGANLASGRFRRASSDEDLMAIIRNGIPETLMIPRPQLSYGDLRSLVAFLRTMQSGGVQTAQDEAEVTIGDAVRGAELFFGSADCSSCHGVNGGGTRLHPDLAGIGSQRSAFVLQQSILDPRAVVREGQRFYQVTAKDGTTVAGKLLNQDTHSVQLMNEQEKLVSFRKEDLESHGVIPTPMPAYLDVLSATDVADLVAYLLSLTTEQAP